MYFGKKNTKKIKYNSCPDLNEALTKLTISFADEEGISDAHNKTADGIINEEELSWGGHYKAHLVKQSSLASLHSNNNGKQHRADSIQRSPTLLYGSQQWLDTFSETVSRSGSAFSLYSSMDLLTVKKVNTVKVLKLKGKCTL